MTAGGGALTGAQRKWLRGQAHALRPIVQLGRQSLSEAALRQIDTALDAHELVKVQAAVPREEKDALAEGLGERLRAEVAGVIGHVFILYRRNPDPEKRRIEIPGRRQAFPLQGERPPLEGERSPRERLSPLGPAPDSVRRSGRAGITCTSAPCRNPSRKLRGGPGSPSPPPCIVCATALPPTSSATATTSAPSKSSSATTTSRPP